MTGCHSSSKKIWKLYKPELFGLKMFIGFSPRLFMIVGLHRSWNLLIARSIGICYLSLTLKLN